MRYLVLFLFLVTSGLALSGQEANKNNAPVPGKMVVLGKRQGAVNLLRWTGTDYVTWQQMAAAGVYVDRFTLVKGVAVPSSRRLLTPQPLTPQPLEVWKTIYTATDTAAGAAAQALFGQAVPLPGDGGFEAVVSMQMQQGMLYGIGMLMADWRPDLATTMALRLEDKDIVPTASYVYRIYTARPISTTADTIYCVVKPSEKWRAPVITDLKATELEKKIQLSWTDEGNLYPASGYFIERSADGGRSFQKLNSTPFIKINTKDSEQADEDRVVFVDSIGVNYRPFIYRVLAFNAFGEIGTAEKQIKAMGRDRTPPAVPTIKEPVFTTGKGLTIEWETAPDELLKGFFVGHSNHADEQFTPLHKDMLPPGTRTFLDPVANARGGVNYYVVTAIDTAGNAITSLPRHYYVDDMTPPATPAGLKATIDSTGYLILSWKPNTEKDLMGYNVFFANAADHEFIQLNGEPLKSDTFIHDLNLVTLTEHIYYKVVAMDEAFNPSAFSEMIQVKKPDILPPAAPLIKDVTVTDKSVTITWAPSPSHDAVQSELFRRKSGDTNWTALGVFQQKQSVWSDTTVVTGQLYEYCLRAMDDDGLRSPYSTPHQGRAYPAFWGDGLKEFTVEKDKEKVVALLSWQFTSQKSARIWLYRAYNDGSLQLITTLPTSETKFPDTAVQSGRRYRYAAKVVYESGAESAMTPANEVVFE